MKVLEKRIGSRKIFIKEFDSIREMVGYCKTAPINKRVFKGDLSSITGSKTFTMTESYEEAQKLLLEGWTAGTDKLTKKLNIANIKLPPKEVQRAMYDIVGFQASVPRYLQGIPTNMVNKKTIRQKQRIITLTKSIAYAAKYTTDEILDDSVKFLQLIQEVEKKGIRVNANVVWHSINGNEEAVFKIPVKKASERLNISKMSYPLTHPSFLRRQCFRLLETEQRITNNFSFGYGRPGRKDDTQPILEKNEYYVPIMVKESDIEEIFDKID